MLLASAVMIPLIKHYLLNLQRLLPTAQFYSKQDSRYWAVLISLLLSLLTLLRGEPINVDGMLYLQAADTYLHEGIKASMQVYPWPLYQLLIAWLHQLTHLPLPMSAHCIDAGLHALLAVAFINLVKELGGNIKIQWLSAIIILIYPALNHDRALLLRDFGYWSLALISLTLLLRYTRTQQWRYAFSWSLLMAIASLFRLEGIILLAMLPLALLLPAPAPLSQRLSLCLRAYSLALIIVIPAGIWLLLHPAAWHTQTLGRLPELLQQVQQALAASRANIHAKAQLFATTALSDLAKGNAQPILIGGLLSLFVWQWLSTINPLLALLCAYALAHKLIPVNAYTRNIFCLALLLNISMLLLFLSQQFFLSPRYLVFPSLLLLVWVPFSLDKLYQDWRSGLAANRWLLPSVAFLLMVMAAGSLHHFGPSKAYLAQAGHWLQNKMPAQSKLCSNSLEVLFAARQPTASWQVPTIRQIHALTLSASCSKADYIAWRINRNEPPVQLTGLAQPAARFENQRGDRVWIFQHVRARKRALEDGR